MRDRFTAIRKHLIAAKRHAKTLKLKDETVYEFSVLFKELHNVRKSVMWEVKYMELENETPHGEGASEKDNDQEQGDEAEEEQGGDQGNLAVEVEPSADTQMGKARDEAKPKIPTTTKTPTKGRRKLSSTGSSSCTTWKRMRVKEEGKVQEVTIKKEKKETTYFEKKPRTSSAGNDQVNTQVKEEGEPSVPPSPTW